MSPQHQRWGGERGPGPPRPAGARPRDPAAGGHFQPLFWKRLPAFFPKIMLNFTPWCLSGPTFGVCTGRCPRCRAVWVLLGPAAAAAGAHRPGCTCPAFLEGCPLKLTGHFSALLHSTKLVDQVVTIHCQCKISMWLVSPQPPKLPI